MSSNFPNLSVLSKVFTNNARIAPTDSNNSLVTKKSGIIMGHPQRLDQDVLVNTLNMFDLNNLDKQSNGLLKGNTKSGGNFLLTPGVVKYTGCDVAPPPPPANDGGGSYVPPLPTEIPLPPPPVAVPPANDQGSNIPPAADDSSAPGYIPPDSSWL